MEPLDLPENVKFAFTDIPELKKYEKLYESVSSKDYGLVCVSVIEIIEKYNLSSHNKYILAVRCITLIMKKNGMYNLISTVPSTIEAIIKLSKGDNINTINSAGIINTISITKLAVKQIIEKIEKKEYNIVENIVLIVTQIMYIVGICSLSGKEKQEITIEVVHTILIHYNVDKYITLKIINLLPSLINILVSVNYREFNINHKCKCC